MKQKARLILRSGIYIFFTNTLGRHGLPSSGLAFCFIFSLTFDYSPLLGSSPSFFFKLVLASKIEFINS